jgi:uncharacterized protein (TIGR03083 family)
MIGTERMLSGEQPSTSDAAADAPHVRNDIGKTNEHWIATYRGWDGPKLLDEFRAVTARRLDGLRALTTAQWDAEGFTPEGPGPYRKFMAIRVFDCWYHDEDIREAIGRPGFLEGPVADLALARIPTKGLGYVVGKKAGAPPGSVVVFDVEGSPEIVAAISVPPVEYLVLLDGAGRSRPCESRPTAHVPDDLPQGRRWTGRARPAPHEFVCASRAPSNSATSSSTAAGVHDLARESHHRRAPPPFQTDGVRRPAPGATCSRNNRALSPALRLQPASPFEGSCGRRPHDVEDTTRARHEHQLRDHVLVVVKEVRRRAHGTVRIVSGHAVGDADSVFLHAPMVPSPPAGCRQVVAGGAKSIVN